MSYNKYHNKRVDYDGYTFDSKMEMRRYQELSLLQHGGEISNLQVHPRFEIIPAFRRNGKAVKATFYEGDFMYLEDFQWVVEDVKGHETEGFKIKRKLFMCRYPDHDLRVIKD